ncbi:SH3 domain-containing protein [Pseudoalteromonas sp. MMG013]|uniref:SH3 domain-containing protein n=1 Tax=Pseudoalteromonas sp. MMG013 TaxID=2822687 RepID=UPI001B3742BA|nr:SH3 domain-containing protein [Pseudoalteromonas sp. MMG013]MBQ4863763.1 SH3 domain-containing protein [Pseudoalteromonas sp. MMG013]
MNFKCVWLLCICILFGNAAVAASTDLQCSIMEVAKNVNVRSMPTKNSKKIGYLQVGQQYVETEQQGNWSRVWFKNKQYWVYRKGYLKSVSGQCVQIMNTETGHVNVRESSNKYTQKIGVAPEKSLWALQAKEGMWAKLWYDAKPAYIHTKYAKDTNPLLKDVIADPNFLKCLSENHTRASDVTSINCARRKIESTRGIEFLRLLIEARLSGNQIKEIDTKHNIRLEVLDLSVNQLSSVNVTENPELVELSVTYNELVDIELYRNQRLKNLSVGNNNLQKIDITNNVHLVEFYAEYNELTTLDVSKNLKLNNLDISNNNIAEVDLSLNENLKTLIVESNQLQELNVRNNLELTSILANNNFLNEIDVFNNVELVFFYAEHNALERINVENNKKLVSLFLGFNALAEIDVSNNSELKRFRAHVNQLTKIDLAENSSLIELVLDRNKIENIDFSNNLELEIIGLERNRISQLDINNNIKLRLLGIDENVICVGARCVIRKVWMKQL